MSFIQSCIDNEIDDDFLSLFDSIYVLNTMLIIILLIILVPVLVTFFVGEPEEEKTLKNDILGYFYFFKAITFLIVTVLGSFVYFILKTFIIFEVKVETDCLIKDKELDEFEESLKRLYISEISTFILYLTFLLLIMYLEIRIDHKEYSPGSGSVM